MASLFGNTTVVDGSVPLDIRGKLPILRQPAGTSRQERLDAPDAYSDPKQLPRILQSLQNTMREMVGAVRRLPEAGSRTIIRDVAFSSGVARVLPHYLAVAVAPTGTSRLGSRGAVTAAAPTQIRFEIFNQRTAAGACYRSAVDERTITLVPNATFTADVRLFVLP